MKYPMINKQSCREVNIPQLSGGLNLRDSLTGVRDNQMTDCFNMWYKDGMLRTRPPFVTSLARLNTNSCSMENEKVSTVFHDEIKIVYNGFKCVVASNKRVFTDESGANKCNIGFEFQAVEKIFVMPEISNISGGEDLTYFCAEMGGMLYCYISDFSIWKLEYSKTVELGEAVPQWEKINHTDYYVPTAYAHCKRTGWDSYEGTQFEGYNLINNSYKMIYSAYNESDSDTTHPMRFGLGQELAVSGEITVEITSYDIESDKPNTVKHSIQYDELIGKEIKNGKLVYESYAYDETPADGLYLFVWNNCVGFSYKEGISAGEVAVLNTDERVKKYGLIEDNVVITAQYDTVKNDLKKVFYMTKATWFGGDAKGISGGSRLFLCANTNEKSLVLWSGLNEPLYFGENCYTYVGGKSQAVTAFGRQGENLVIFKENEIYCAYYAQNTGIDADDLINQTIVDYEANSTYFPIVLINGFIGCDCPDTIQMCRNRLVWASSEGKVYTLCTMSQYNEHTVYEISDMINPKLKENKSKLKTATSADFDGCYILFLDDNACVMDYSCYGYQYIYSYSKTNDANALIPWYFWDFGFLKGEETNDMYSNACICVLDGALLMRTYFNASFGDKSAFIGFCMKEDNYSGADIIFFNDLKSDLLQLKESSIDSSLRTKLFELGNGVYNINVDAVTVKMSVNSGEDVLVNVITDQNKETFIIKNKKEFISMYTTNLIKTKRIHPTTRSILRFGLEVCCSGMLCVDGLSIRYRLLGGVK